MARISPKLELLNSEGSILTLYRVNDGVFTLVDRWGTAIALFSKKDVLRFINGEGDVVDSKGNSWNYPEQSQCMKPSMERILEFLNGER